MYLSDISFSLYTRHADGRHLPHHHRDVVVFLSIAASRGLGVAPLITFQALTPAAALTVRLARGFGAAAVVPAGFAGARARSGRARTRTAVRRLRVQLDDGLLRLGGGSC